MVDLDHLEQYWILNYPMSPVTASKYRSRLESLGRRGMRVDQVLGGDVDELATWLTRRRRSASIEAYRNELKAAKATTRALVELQVLDVDVGRKWKLPPDPPRRPQSLSVDELQRLLQWRHPDPAQWSRDLALLQLGFFANARRGELHRLDVEDLGESWIHVQASKNHVTADVPVEAEAFAGHVARWLELRPEPADGNRALFVDLRRPHRRLGPKGVYGALQRVGRDVGIRLNANRLRHTRIRTLHRAGWPESLLMLMARHRGRDAIVTYIEPSLEDAAERIRAGQGTGFLGSQRAACHACGRRLPVGRPGRPAR